MLPYNIHHTAIAVSDLDRTLEYYATNFKIRPISIETIDDQGVREAMIALGGSHIQLLEPLHPDTPVGRFLAKHGEGLHHIAFAVTDIDTAVAHLREQGVSLIDEVPRRGGGGHRIAFVHPRDHNGTLIELVEVHDG
ncbi:MAG: methylmalonyl-CoA epimerase [Actinomycetia bacterium]|nr:methylmalonyl-CoA epimerase [Actinomycetes bacterium]